MEMSLAAVIPVYVSQFSASCSVWPLNVAGWTVVPGAPVISAARLFTMMEIPARQGAAMSAHKPDHIINHQETAARLAAILEEVVRDLDELAREFAAPRSTFVHPPSEPVAKTRVN
jgi:hypothetical protein